MIEALRDWELIKTELNSFYDKGFEINDLHPKNEEEYENLKSNYYDWKQKVLDFLMASLKESIGYVDNFKSLNTDKFNISNSRPVPLEKKTRDLKGAIQNAILYIKKTINLLSISDMVTVPQKIDWTNRNNYTSKQIKDLLLRKLFDLYSDEFYPIRYILLGNGIYLQKKREEFEYLRILQEEELIESQNIAKIADAKLTLIGKLYVEEKYKLFTPDYESINNDKQEISSQIDELKLKLKELGVGQEVIFNELDELKELYSSLNKKNWGQLLKGKIIDLGIEQVIDKDVAEMIFKSITKDVLRLM